MAKLTVTTYRYPSQRCRYDQDFREQYFLDIRTFYRYTDGIFNCTYIGKIFNTTAKYARQVLHDCPKCTEILNRRRYRRKLEGIKRSDLVTAVLKLWREDPENVFIDDLGLRFNFPVVSIQTIINKRHDASEDERKRKHPLSFSSAAEFYARNKWKDEEGFWTKPVKNIGWGLKKELRARNRTFNESPWPEDEQIWKQAVSELEHTPIDLVVQKFNLPSTQALLQFIQRMA